MINREIFSEDHELFRAQARRYFEKEVLPVHAAWEKSGAIPREFWNKFGDAGYLCTSIPASYGGVEADKLYSVIIAEELCALGLLSPALSFAMHSEIVATYVLHYGSEDQRREWLPDMVAGKRVGALAMSEPSGGSDVQSLKTTASLVGNHYVINGQKVFISNGQNADLVIVACKTDSKLGAKGVSLIAVEADRDGFTRGRKLDKIGLQSSDTSELFFENVKVPATNLLGEEGRGFTMMMEQLPWERLQIAITAVAAADATLKETIEYTKQRHAFGAPIVSFQNTRFRLAEMATELRIARTFVDSCISKVMNSTLDVATAAMAKYWTTDLQCKVVDECVQLHGGYGYMREYAVARAYVDARAQRIYGGTNEIMKELIARSL